jgi:hypothetical protein
MSLDLVAITPNLALEIKRNEIKDKVIKRLDELKLLDTKYKMNNDILLLICNLVEHLIKDKKINKKEFVLDIFQHIFNIDETEKQIVSSNIEFLHSSRAIRRLSRFYLFCCSAYEYLFKKKEKKV